ncbi:MAG: spore coat U domain-containing protein [Desulfobacterales bacterium]
MKSLQLCCLIVFLLLNIQTGLACDLLHATVSGFAQSDGSRDIENMQIANLQLRCDKQFRLGLDGGLNYSGIRRLGDGKGNYIPYYLWQDSGSNAEWGSNKVETVTPYPADSFSGKGSGASETCPVYGTAFPAGGYPPGVYADTVRAVLSYVPFGSGVPLETDLHISLEIVGNCTLNLDGLGDFGQWQTGSPDLKGIPLGTITVNCNPPGMTYAIGMGAGLHFRGGMRHMVSGAEFIPYILCADSACSYPWGDSGLSFFEPGYAQSHPSPAQTAVSTGQTQSFSVFGDAMISTSPSGNYNDTVSVTVVWQ